MSPHVHFDHGSWEFPASLALALLLAASLYLRAWISARSGSIPAWKAGSFVLGLVLLWTASGSPLAAYDHSLLTVHMIKHLLLMTFAPPLILLGEPLRVFWRMTPLWARGILGRVWRRPPVQRLAGIVTSLVLCWTASALTLILWHVPALFALGIRSATGHTVEQAMFFGTGLLFWWPVIEPWPSAAAGPRWSLLLYLFLATLPCDVLSGFLVFSDRVAYPVYFSTPRLLGFSVLADQQCAAALMWTCVTLVYLVPAAIISAKLLAPRASREHDLAQSRFSGGAVPESARGSLEVV
ncbi:MAG TPA: cytochrome c oxidase assembly protein [Candidatus Saccharimonadales bacterium]|nr:cytochrome c oxidase assembly protein [Candidatus Saccharimonadales bacterium]